MHKVEYIKVELAKDVGLKDVDDLYEVIKGHYAIRKIQFAVKNDSIV